MDNMTAKVSCFARSEYCESKLVDEKNFGCMQYMIFASGCDTFSMRNSGESLLVYELDLPEVISDKMERVAKSKAIYIPCNLAGEVWF